MLKWLRSWERRAVEEVWFLVAILIAVDEIPDILRVRDTTFHMPQTAGLTSSIIRSTEPSKFGQMLGTRTSSLETAID